MCSLPTHAWASCSFNPTWTSRTWASCESIRGAEFEAKLFDDRQLQQQQRASVAEVFHRFVEPLAHQPPAFGSDGCLSPGRSGVARLSTVELDQAVGAQRVQGPVDEGTANRPDVSELTIGRKALRQSETMLGRAAEQPQHRPLGWQQVPH